jgi:hypothetical protein
VFSFSFHLFVLLLVHLWHRLDYWFKFNWQQLFFGFTSTTMFHQLVLSPPPSYLHRRVPANMIEIIMVRAWICLDPTMLPK